jgi:hypothetical protein
MLTFDEKQLLVGTIDGSLYLLNLNHPFPQPSNLETRCLLATHLT